MNNFLVEHQITAPFIFTLQIFCPMTEAYALLLIVLVLAILFTIGLWRTSKAFRKHAEKIKEVFTPYSDYLGFMRYGRGFKALCIPKKGSNFSRIDITVSLTWRENPLFYILYPITKDKDRIFLWGELVEMPDVNIEIRRGESTDPGRGVKISDLNFVVVTDDREKAFALIDRIRGYLKDSESCLESLKMGRDYKWVKVMGRIEDDESIRKMFDILVKAGEIAPIL